MESSRSPSSTAPATIREKSLRYGRYLSHVDIDLGGPLLNSRDIRVVDCGDVIMDPASLVGNSAATTKAIRTIRGKNAIPIILGGDHPILIPVMLKVAII